MSCSIEDMAEAAQTERTAVWLARQDREASETAAKLRDSVGFKVYDCLGKVWREGRYICFGVRRRGPLGWFGFKRTLAVWDEPKSSNPFGDWSGLTVAPKEWVGIASLGSSFNSPETFLVAIDQLR